MYPILLSIASFITLAALYNKINTCKITPSKGKLQSETNKSIDTTKTGIKRYIVFFGGFPMQLTLGSLFSFGNLVPYFASYMTYNEHISNNEQLTDLELENIYNSYISLLNGLFFVNMFFHTVLIIFGGKLELKIGPTNTLIIASLCITSGFGLVYFGLIFNSMIIITLTFGIIFGSGVGIGYSVHSIVCMRWFNRKQGLVNGISSAIFGFGPFVFNAIQTKLANPYNIELNNHYGYTKNYDIIHNIPLMFIYVSIIMIIFQIISIFCVKNPNWFTVNNESETQKSKSQIKYESDSLNVKQTLSLCHFWHLWSNNFLFTIASIWLAVEWKMFGVKYMNINNDKYLSMVGSIGSLSNGIGRFLWGIFYDFSESFSLSMGLQSIIAAIFIITLPFIYGEIMFIIWIIIIWFCVSCQYSFLPNMISKTFGTRYTGAILGVFAVCEPPAMCIVALLSSITFLQNNYRYYCFIIGGCCAISALLSVLYVSGKVNRKEYLERLLTQ